ncbi:NUDIX domain-containing protein [Streptomyces sp. NPDC000594]|uniref:NUDIX hydrolase n=1 Tax=Streptomyces sp. NPDC000594 TaxID=3154261 RepID=UPI00333132E8
MSDDSLEPLGTAALLVNPAGQYLLHLRDANKPWICDPGTWSIPGGNRKEGEPSRRAVERELMEETGLAFKDLVPFTVVETLAPDGRTRSRIQVYLGTWDGNADTIPVTEGIMYRWFDAATMRWLTMCPWTKEVIDLHQAQPGTGPGPWPSAAPAPGRPRTALHIVGGHLYLERDGHVLLGRRHPDAAFGADLLHTLAGHVDDGEPVRHCVVREAREEAGLTIDPADLTLVHTVHMPGAPGAAPRLQLFFRARRWEGEPQVMEPECTTVWEWWPREALPDDLVPYTRAAIDGIAAGRACTELGW